MKRSRGLVVAAAVLAAATAGAVPALTAGGHRGPAAEHSAMAADQAATSSLCDFQTATADGGQYTLQNNEYDSGAPECLSTDGGTDFSVASSSISNSTSGSPGGYPSLYKGCHWGACTTGSGLPLAVSALTTGAVTTSWNTTQPGTGAYDVAYDIWLNQTPATSGQPNGAEVMIWLNHNGSVQPFGSQVGTASIGGHSYNVWEGNQGWNTISYTMTTGATSVSNLDIGQVVADAVSRGYIQKSWYLIDVEAGFELWQGGAGLATNSFSVDVNGNDAGGGAGGGSTGGGSSTPPSSPPPSASGTCSASYAVTGSWAGGFQGQVTVKNTSSSAVSGWKLGWSFPGDQKINNLWNGAVTQSGEQVSVTNAGYNGSLAPGASATVGFTGTYASSNASPPAITLNGTACTS